MSVAVAVDKDNNDIINDDDDDTTINFQVAVKVNQRIDDAVDGDDGVGNESQTNNACPTTTATTRTNNNLLPKFSIICRICHTNDVPERLISPCRCKGTLAFVHKSCLEHWLRESAHQHCELCQHRYPLRQTLRYKWWEALLVWYRNPRNRHVLQSDVLVCSLLTVVTFTLVTICILALNFFALHESSTIVSVQWTEGTLVIFLSIVIFAYALNVLVLIKSHCIPWYRWWQSVKFVVLAIDNHGREQFDSNDPTVV